MKRVPCSRHVAMLLLLAGLAACGGGDGDSTPPNDSLQNRVPVAESGADQNVAAGNTVTLGGSASSDPDGDTLSHSWIQVSGSTVALSGANTVTASFTAPTSASAMTLVFRLTVSDGRGGSASDDVSVQVSPTEPGNHAPVAAISAPTAVIAGGNVTLDGLASSDPDGDALIFSWTLVLESPAVTLTGASTSTATFVAPSVAVPTEQRFRLTVDDGRGGTTFDEVSIVISPAPANVQAARIEIVQTGLLLTSLGETRQLAARVFDANGAPIQTSVTWSSSDSSSISINATGLARATSASGSSQIVANIGDTASPPLLAVVAAVAPGVVTIDDEQIVRGPAAASTGTTPDDEDTYTVVLAGTSAPALNSLLVGTGSQPIAGRVMNTQTISDGILVTLQLVPITALFPDLEIDQVMDLRNTTVEIAPGIAEEYDIVIEGDTYAFTAQDVQTQSSAILEKAGRRPVPPSFKCEGSTAGFANGTLLLATAPSFKVRILKLDGTFQVDARRGNLNIGLASDLQLDYDVKLALQAGFSGEVRCDLELLRPILFTGGPLSLYFGLTAPMGAGLELSADGLASELDVGASEARASASLDVRYVCTFGNCEFKPAVTNPQLTAALSLSSSPPDTGLRFEPSLGLFLFARSAVGSVLNRSLQADFFEARFGLEWRGSYAFPLLQMSDASYQSGYDLSFLAAAEPRLPGKFLKRFGLDASRLVIADLSFGPKLASSPTGSIVADRAKVAPGDVAEFTVNLQNTTFFGAYNVGEVQLIRNRGSSSEIVDRAPASNGQSQFKLFFPATDVNQSGTYFAFVVPRIASLNLTPFEIGNTQIVIEVPPPPTPPPSPPPPPPPPPPPCIPPICGPGDPGGGGGGGVI